MDEEIREAFASLAETVRRLRGPGGCPWDRDQTHHSLKRYVIEETYEVVDAIDAGVPEKLEEELGDLLLQVLLHAEIAGESGEFDIAGVCRRIDEKLRRRHPHVFGEVTVEGVDEVLHNWEQIKRAEPGNEDRVSALDGVPHSLPALMRAAKLSKKAAATGFDWPDVNAVLAKLREEVDELEQALGQNQPNDIAAEIGDILFTVVNIARHRKIDPEDALRGMLDRFNARFRHIESRASDQGRTVEEMTLEEMDRAWDEAKRDS